MTNAAIVVEGGEVAWVGQRNAIPKTPQGERSEVVPSPSCPTSLSPQDSTRPDLVSAMPLPKPALMAVTRAN